MSAGNGAKHKPTPQAIKWRNHLAAKKKYTKTKSLASERKKEK